MGNCGCCHHGCCDNEPDKKEPEEKVEELKKDIENLGYKIEETADGEIKVTE